jgi:hypothetical protein
VRPGGGQAQGLGRAGVLLGAIVERSQEVLCRVRTYMALFSVRFNLGFRY